MKSFLNYIKTGQDDGKSTLVREIEADVCKARKHEEWRMQYMTQQMINQENQEIGRREGIKEGIKDTILTLLKFRESQMTEAADGGRTGAGWRKFAGHWYCFDGNGYAAGPGWWRDTRNVNDPKHASGGSWYYFDEYCRLLVDTTTPDGHRVDANGRWVE
ncbi:MAG: hypothetical protein Q4E54_02015 [Lachnospiraceae bacterium]|nr:hypothetical protein [Lachnospiraceae bacterium]